MTGPGGQVPGSCMQFYTLILRRKLTMTRVMIADLADDWSSGTGTWFLHAVLSLDTDKEINNDEGNDCRPGR